MGKVFSISAFLLIVFAGCALPAVSVEDGKGVSISADGNSVVKISLGPGGCIKEDDCRAYCQANLQECIGWCSENEHYLCGTIAGEYFG